MIKNALEKGSTLWRFKSPNVRRKKKHERKKEKNQPL